jgi:hypothetical protein
VWTGTDASVNESRYGCLTPDESDVFRLGIVLKKKRPSFPRLGSDGLMKMLKIERN